MKAYEVLEKYGWTQGTYARDAKGGSIEVTGNRAASFCALGAIYRAYEAHDTHDIIEKLKRRLFSASRIDLWNDDPSRTKEEVIKVFKELDI